MCVKCLKQTDRQTDRLNRPINPRSIQDFKNNKGGKSGANSNLNLCSHGQLDEVTTTPEMLIPPTMGAGICLSCIDTVAAASVGDDEPPTT